MYYAHTYPRGLGAKLKHQIRRNEHPTQRVLHIQRTVATAIIAVAVWVPVIDALGWSDPIVIEKNGGARVNQDSPSTTEDTPEDHGASVQQTEEAVGAPLSIAEKIKQTFPEDSETALKIADCESRLDPARVGDTHLTFQHNGETLGHSVGLMQVRTGGNEKGRVWSRALGMSAEAYTEKLKNPDYNLSEARKIYDRAGGWGPWTCSRLID